MEAQYDLWWGLLEEGRPPPPPPPPPRPLITAEPIAADIDPRAVRLKSKAEQDNPDWTCGNVVGIVCLVYIFFILVPRSRNRDYMLLYCVFAVVLSLAFPTLAYVLTLDVELVDRFPKVSPMSSVLFS